MIPRRTLLQQERLLLKPPSRQPPQTLHLSNKIRLPHHRRSQCHTGHSVVRVGGVHPSDTEVDGGALEQDARGRSRDRAGLQRLVELFLEFGKGPVKDVFAEVGGRKGASVLVLDRVPAVRDGVLQRDLEEGGDGTGYPWADERCHFPRRWHQPEPREKLDVPLENADDILAHLVHPEHIMRDHESAFPARMPELLLAVSKGLHYTPEPGNVVRRRALRTGEGKGRRFRLGGERECVSCRGGFLLSRRVVVEREGIDESCLSSCQQTVGDTKATNDPPPAPTETLPDVPTSPFFHPARNPRNTSADSTCTHANT
jgi:hypothetical protein